LALKLAIYINRLNSLGPKGPKREEIPYREGEGVIEINRRHKRQKETPEGVI
jgi:hypothetical protein